jgi:hypothetical protein
VLSPRAIPPLLLLVVALVVAAIEARAADAKTSSLSWLRMPGADGCVATQPLARAIEDRLGRAVFVSAAQADLSVEGRIEKRKGAPGWHAVITVRDSNGATLGTRELDRPDASCEAMTEPLALIVAVMIDPDAAMRPGPAPSASDTPPMPSATTTTTADASLPIPSATTAPSSSASVDRPPVLPPKSDPWRFEGHAAVTVSNGITPTLAPGAGVEAILYPPNIPLGFRGYTTLFLPTNAEKDGARASFDMLYVGGGLCPTLRRRVSLMGCLGGQLGILRPRSETSNRGISEDLLPVWNAMLELRLHVPIVAPIGVAAGVGAGIPILRPRLDYTTKGNTVDTLHRADAFVLTADLGVGFFFP